MKSPNRCLIVAEISANHNQDFGTAVKLIKKAKECGADAVKFQAYTPDSLTIREDNRYFRIRHLRWGGQTLYQLYRKAYMPLSWLGRLKKVSDNEDIIFFATAFDRAGVDLLESIGVPFHKIASFELVDLSLIEYAAKTRKPLILSTGMATLTEIKEAIGVARKAGARDITLLKCVSNYPAKTEDMNLKAIPRLANLFKCRVGLSDHTLGTIVPVAAASLGAIMIEKHFTLSNKKKSPDSFFSLEADDFIKMVKDVRTAEKALGEIRFGPTNEEKKSIVFRRSLFAVKDIKKGEVFTEKNIRSIRPAYGLKPKYLRSVIGRRALRNIERGTPIRWNMIREGN